MTAISTTPLGWKLSAPAPLRRRGTRATARVLPRSARADAAIIDGKAIAFNGHLFLRHCGVQRIGKGQVQGLGGLCQLEAATSFAGQVTQKPDIRLLRQTNRVDRGALVFQRWQQGIENAFFLGPTGVFATGHASLW